MKSKNNDFIISEEFAPTSDGWKLALRRYKPTGNKPKTPVILCHGLANNRYGLDFDEMYGDKYSLAKYLVKGGNDGKEKFDVWVLELRGHGNSMTFYPWKKPWKYNWNFDTYVEHDVPDTIRFVKRKCDSESVFWIGHSMGGILAYAYGETKEGKKNFKGVVTIGSPVKFDGLRANLAEEKYEWFISLLKIIFTPEMPALPLLGPEFLKIAKYKEIQDFIINSKLLSFFVNKDNMDKEVLRRFLEVGGGTTCTKVLCQFILCFQINDFCRYPKWPRLCERFHDYPILGKIFCPYSYRENLKKFVSPILFIAGGGDKLTTTDDIFYTYDQVGSKDKEYKEFSIDKGYSADYGHVDLVVGRNSKIEVFKEAYDWLKKHL